MDGGNGGMAALRWALLEAQAVGASIEAVHAWTTVRSANLVAREVWIASRPHNSPPEIRQRSQHGPADEVLVAGSRRADLLVLGSRPRPQPGPHLLGPVAMACRLRAVCPVAFIDQFNRRMADSAIDLLVAVDRLVQRTGDADDEGFVPDRTQSSLVGTWPPNGVRTVERLR
ncbi:MAG: universal stress protein [Nakamurella sp.]